MILDVLCVLTPYLPIIVYGNGRTREVTGHASECVVSETELTHKECGTEPQRTQAIHNEKRARYDVLEYGSIICHTNVTIDPSTGHILQSIQMI